MVYQEKSDMTRRTTSIEWKSSIQKNHQQKQKLWWRMPVKHDITSKIPGSPSFLQCSAHGKTNKEQVKRSKKKRAGTKCWLFGSKDFVQSPHFTSAAMWKLSHLFNTKLSDNQYGSLNSSSFLRFQIQEDSSSQRNTRSWGLQKTPSSSLVCLIPPPSSSKDTLSLTPHAKEPIQVSWLTPRLSLLKLNAFTKIYISWLPTAVNPEAGLKDLQKSQICDLKRANPSTCSSLALPAIHWHTSRSRVYI